MAKLEKSNLGSNPEEPSQRKDNRLKAGDIN